MAASKKFSYSTGEEDATDSYLRSVAGERASTVEMQDIQHSRSVYAGAYDDRPEYENNCSRWVVMTLSVVFFLCGIAVIVIGAVQKSKSILTLCPKCSDLIVGLYIVGGSIAGMGLLGVLAAKTRLKVIAFLFTFLILLVGLALLAVGVAAVIFQTGVKEFNTEQLWKDEVGKNETFICQLQTSMNCSGYGTCCNSPQYTTELSSSDNMLNLLGASIAPVCSSNTTSTALIDVCDPLCFKSNANLEPCDQKIKQELKTHFVAFIGVGFGMGVIMLLASVASVRMTFKSS